MIRPQRHHILFWYSHFMSLFSWETIPYCEDWSDLFLKVLQLKWFLHLATIPPTVTQYCSFPESLFIFGWPSPAPSSRQRAEFNLFKSIQRTNTFTPRDQQCWLWLIFTNVTIYWLTFNQTGYKKNKKKYFIFFCDPWINLSDRVKHAAQKIHQKYLYFIIMQSLFLVVSLHLCQNVSAATTGRRPWCVSCNIWTWVLNVY